MKEVLDLSLAAYIKRIAPLETFEDELIVQEITNITDFGDVKFRPMRLSGVSIFLVLTGELTIDLGKQCHQLLPNMVLEMEDGDIMESITLSPDCKAFHILISIPLKIEMTSPAVAYFPRDSIILKLLYPARVLCKKEVDDLLAIIYQLQKYIAHKDHIFRAQMIKNELSSLIFEMQHQLCSQHGDEKIEMLENETIKHRFRLLIAAHAREEHEVSFYADKLNVTSDYLSKVARNTNGESALKWINKALITEAKVLLRKPDTTIQQVADTLHFYDQSAFGKFFKAQTGQSPLEYKKG